MQFARCRRRRRQLVIAAVAVCAAASLGCGRHGDPSMLGTFRMGEKVQVGPLTYTVLEAQWKPTLTEADVSHPPKDRYLFLKVSAANGGNATVTLPSLELRAANSATYPEVSQNVQDVPGWLGMLRMVPPGKTDTGWVVFDAPIASYKLMISDGGDAGNEKYAHVEIPVQLD